MDFEKILYKTEYKKYSKILNKLQKKYPTETLTVSITPTGIGDVIKVKNKKASINEDITDYENW